jgi:ATP-dependent helicase HrpA
VIAPGSVLAKRSPRWVMAAELVETNRLWARRVAAVDPAWIERVGAHLVKRSYGEPRWDERRGAAVATETVTLYGLPIVTGRTVPYDRVDPVGARELFIRHALVHREVTGEWPTHHAFVARNEAFRERVQAMEARVRRAGLLDDDAVFEFYDSRVGPDVTSTRRFDQWWKRAEPGLLDLSDEVLAGAGGVRLADYPDTWRHVTNDGELVLPLSYRFDPGGPLDGVSVHVPLTALNQVGDDGFDWHIEGHRAELVEALVRTLPKDMRRQLIPMAETVRAATERLGEPDGRLVDALAATLRDVTGVAVLASAFRPDALPAHLRMNFIVAGADGTIHDADDDLDAIRARLAGTARAAIADAAPVAERRGIVDWDVGNLPQVVESTAGAHVVRGYPALLDDDDSVSLRVLTNADLQQRVMHGGVRRLLLLTAAPPLGRRGDELAQDVRFAAVDRVLTDQGALPWDAEAFAELQQAVRRDAPAIAAAALATARDILAAAARVRARLDRLVAPPLQRSVADATAHLDRLVGGRFVVAAGTQRLADVHRYVRGIEYRVERLSDDVARDLRRMAEVVPLEERYAAMTSRPPELRWKLEELRVSVFAQAIGAHQSVSSVRLARELAAVSVP